MVTRSNPRSAPTIRFTNLEQLAVVAMVVGFLMAIWIPALVRADHQFKIQALDEQESVAWIR